MEHDSHYANRNRVLAWTLYLNDVKEGGETEFLHQSIRVPPVANRFIMWPAYWTHLHRVIHLEWSKVHLYRLDRSTLKSS